MVDALGSVVTGRRKGELVTVSGRALLPCVACVLCIRCFDGTLDCVRGCAGLLPGTRYNFRQRTRPGIDFDQCPVGNDFQTRGMPLTRFMTALCEFPPHANSVSRDCARVRVCWARVSCSSVAAPTPPRPLLSVSCVSREAWLAWVVGRANGSRLPLEEPSFRVVWRRVRQELTGTQVKSSLRGGVGFALAVFTRVC